MSNGTIDLRGNTNFVVLKNLLHQEVVPRTNLAAVDLTVANGLAVAGSTMYANLATADDIAYGTSGHLVDASVLNTVLNDKQDSLEAGIGIEIVAGETASTISVPITDVETLIDGTTATKVVDVAALRGALTTGQAVDVTSAPDGVTGDYLGSFTVTGSSLGFAAFPKYAKNLNYLFIATIVPTTAGTVTPSANCKWLDTGDRAAKSVAAGVSVKLAVTFTSSADTCPASFALSGTGNVTVSYCRQYEVTACTAESIAYIAALSNPDAFADYYLVKADMVQPWTYIIDMGTSPAVTVAAGLSYKLNASTGTHTLTTDTCPVGYDGRDAIIRITLGGSGVVQAVAPLQLGGALVPYAINNCVVRFRDGEAVLLVEDTLAGYVVTVTSGTDSGSLAYGLAAASIPYIAFSTGTDGQVVDMGDAVTANEEVTVVGNGYTNTTVTGNITCTNKTVFANVSLQDVNVMGGTMTLGDVNIPSGSTVAVSSGKLAPGKITGNGGTIDLGGTNIQGGYNVFMSGITVTNGVGTEPLPRGGFAHLNAGNLTMTSCTVSGCRADQGCAIFVTYNSHLISSSTIVGNIGQGQIFTEIATVTIKDSVISGNPNPQQADIMTGGSSGGVQIIGGNTIGVMRLGNATSASFVGSNRVDSVYNRSNASTGIVILSSGAILDLTGNSNATPIAPGGGITFETGGATIYPSAGSTSAATIVGLPSCLTIGNTANITVGNNLYNITTMTLSNCTITSTAGSDIEWDFSTDASTTRIMNFTNCTFSGSESSFISIGLKSGTINATNVTFIRAKPGQHSAESITLNLAGTIKTNGVAGAIGLVATYYVIAANTYLDLSECESSYVLQGNITFGAGVKIKKYGTTEYVDLVEGGTAGTCYRIERNGTVRYSA